PPNLRRLAAALRRGELVALPTETVYGLAANALDARACRAIFKAKGRPAKDPLIVHVLNLAHAEQLAVFNPAARRLARRFWPGPLTLVLPKQPCVPGVVTSGGDTVAVRAPAHPLARRLLRLAGIPLAAPSANLFGYISPTESAHVADGLGRRIKYVLEGGACEVGVESTILDLTNPAKPRILRPGVVTAAALAKFLGRPVGAAPRKSGVGRLLAPGMMARHYSPRTPLVLKNPRGRPLEGVGRILLRKPAGETADNIYWLSERGALSEVARNLYRVLRAADQGGHRQIQVEPLPADAGGLAAALNDRLKRAAARG
ncbi:MAG: L-threonylcarbamoyladenylate synthase, partial [Lacunisphaera sp.]|nr:L-threonylcarbamoyladenylate synthase [Lacunisphaera sp.]